MELDLRVVRYMENRAECAKTVAGACCAQCFVLAVLFCLYGLLGSGFVDSKTMPTARLLTICFSAVVSVALSVFCAQVCIKSKSVSILEPDSIALRQSRQTVWEAYVIARPVLVYKITLGILSLLVSGLAYIIIMILLNRSFIATIYAKVAVCLLGALGVYLVVPSLDRIASYRRMLNETHYDVTMSAGVYRACMAVAILEPLTVFVWYFIRFYTGKNEIAWIVFPIIMLFATAIVYLMGWTKENSVDNG